MDLVENFRSIGLMCSICERTDARLVKVRTRVPRTEFRAFSLVCMGCLDRVQSRLALKDAERRLGDTQAELTETTLELEDVRAAAGEFAAHIRQTLDTNELVYDVILETLSLIKSVKKKEL